MGDVSGEWDFEYFACKNATVAGVGHPKSMGVSIETALGLVTDPYEKVQSQLPYALDYRR